MHYEKFFCPVQNFNIIFLYYEYKLIDCYFSKKEILFNFFNKIFSEIDFYSPMGLIARITERISLNFIFYDNTELIGIRLFKSNQNNCNGYVSSIKVEIIRAKLDAYRPIGIKFNRAKVTSFINGGTCSAMSLEFIDSYFKAKKTTLEYPDSRSKVLINHLIALGKKFLSSSKEMRERQAAYNTIEVKFSDSSIDYSKNKMQALANYHSLIINYSSPEINFDKIKNKHELSKEINVLPEGVFLIRIIKPKNNKKLEEFGHTFVYIKENELDLLYDPNFGLINLRRIDFLEILYNSLNHYYQLRKMSQLRFHQIKKAID